ncbi:MAG TPA: tail fiber protein [Bryobacteraceae bacterium]|jgi:microcystin-dependent protein|nr:tail fiber protein [Bryobacteraceae bacterium]
MASQPYLGAIFIFAGNFAPRGYQLCQGQLLPISQNTALFSILGTTYGGNGTSTFALPDLRGRIPVGVGSGPGLNPIEQGELSGVQNVTILTSNMPAHNHLINAADSGGGLSSPKASFLAQPLDANQSPTTMYSANAAPAATMAPNAVSVTGQSLPLNIQNPYLGLNYIIAMEGIFPSRN